MKKTTALNLIPSLTLAAVLVALAGCATKGNYQTGAATGAGLVDAGNKVAIGSGQIDATLGALNDLVNDPQGDLVPKFKKFNDCVADLKAMSDDVKARFTDARVKGNDYFKQWDEQLSTIRNQDIKNASAQRKADVEKKYNALKRGYAQVQMSFDPFMSDLKDIQTALGTDLTAGGIASVKGASVTANKDGIALKTSLSQLSSQFVDLGTAMQAAVPPAPPSTGTNQMNQTNM